MKTEIEFLHELREDLMDAAAHEASRRRRVPSLRALMPTAGGIRPTRRPRARWKLVAASTTAILGVAGVIGYAAGHTGGPERKVGAGRRPAATVPSGYNRYAPLNDKGLSVADSRRFANLVEDIPATTQEAVRIGDTRLPDGVPAVGPNGIKTGEIDVEVDQGTFSDQFSEATAIAERYGGYVQTSTTSGTDRRSGSMVMRVPADRFSLALGDLRALGKPLREVVSGVDVTARFVDLGARLRNAEAQERSLRKLLAEAPDVTSTLRVNGVLSDVELRIEELRGQLRLLKNRADLGTIQLSMSEKGAKPAEVATVEKPKLGEALERGVAGFLGVIFSIVVGIGYLLPILALIAVAWFVVRQVRRGRRTRPVEA